MAYLMTYELPKNGKCGKAYEGICKVTRVTFERICIIDLCTVHGLRYTFIQLISVQSHRSIVDYTFKNICEKKTAAV